MKIGFFVSGIASEHPNFAATRLAREAVEQEREVGYICAESLS
jgi:hypothetical protein